MGHRVQYLIKSGGSRTGYYSQWGGLTLELDLLAGPETALRFVRGQRAVDFRCSRSSPM